MMCTWKALVHFSWWFPSFARAKAWLKNMTLYAIKLLLCPPTKESFSRHIVAASVGFLLGYCDHWHSLSVRTARPVPKKTTFGDDDVCLAALSISYLMMGWGSSETNAESQRWQRASFDASFFGGRKGKCLTNQIRSYLCSKASFLNFMRKCILSVIISYFFVSFLLLRSIQCVFLSLKEVRKRRCGIFRPNTFPLQSPLNVM